MRFKQFAGTTIMPTLGRLVLSLAFVTVGYNKLINWTEFTPAQADVLRNLGVTVRTAEPTVALGHDGMIVPVRLLQETPDVPATAPAEAEPEEEAPAVTPTADDPPAPLPAEVVEAAVEDLPVVEAPPEIVIDMEATPAEETPSGGGTARSMHKVTLLCHGQGWPSPQYLALLAALTELVGGSLLLVGLLSRIWGLGLAIAMGVAIHLTSREAYLSAGPFTVAEGGDEYHLFNQVFSQLGLLVLSVGIFLTGPGPLSLDHLIFRRRHKMSDGDIGEIVFDEDASVGGQPSI